MGTDSDSLHRGQRLAITSTTLWFTILVVSLILLNHPNEVESTVCTDKSVESIAVVHRHGDRTGVFQYGNDPNGNRQWEGGKGALTEKGKAQLCNMGFTLKGRYSSLLPAGGDYTQRNTRVISSPRQRCIDSVVSLLKCLTSKNMNGKWVFLDQPVDFTILGQQYDDILLQSKSCPTYDAMLNELSYNPKPGSAIYDFNREHAGLYAHVSQYTGEPIRDSVRIGEIYDAILVQRNNNWLMPNWAPSVFPGKLREVKERSALLLTENDYMKLIKGGRLATTIIEQLLLKTNMQTQKRIEIYSAHDSTLVNLMNALGLIKQTGAEPGYGAALVFELHKECDDWIIRIVYFSDANQKSPKKILIPGCQDPCKLEDYRKLISNIWLPAARYETECRNPYPQTTLKPKWQLAAMPEPTPEPIPPMDVKNFWDKEFVHPFLVGLRTRDITPVALQAKYISFYNAVRHVLSAEGKSKYTTSKVRLDNLQDPSPRVIYNEINGWALGEMQTMIQYCEPPGKKSALNFLVFSALRSISDFRNDHDDEHHNSLFFENYLKVGIAHNELSPMKAECYKNQLMTFSAVEHTDTMAQIVALLMKKLAQRAQTPAT